MVRGRRSGGLLVGALLLALGAGCGPSQEEYDKKAREVEDLKNRLAAEQAASRKAQGELADAKARVEQLKEQLRAAGVDISNLNANLEQQARALEDYKKRAEQLEAIRQRFETLKKKLDELTKFGLKVQIRKGRIVIQLPGDVLFDSGRVDLKKDGKDILLKVAEVVRNDKDLNARTFQVAGHTDNKPLAGGPYKDNWGLSVMRAREVLSFLITPTDQKSGGGGLPIDHWSAAGYGDTDPVAANDNPENMQKNRRVELVVLPNVEEMLDLKSLTR